MKVAVCIPFIDTGCTRRRRARDYIDAHWRSLGLDVFYGTDDREPVNRSAARNHACRQADDADIIVIADADTFIVEEQFWHMVGLASLTGRLVLGYTVHRKLSKASTQRTLAGEFATNGDNVANQPSGIMAVTRGLLERVGGHDERFLGWGGEDRAFQLACDTLAGPGHRIDGLSYHLWHPNDPAKGRATAQRRANQVLALRYKEAAGTPRAAGILGRTKSDTPDPQAMLALLSEPGGPLDGADVRTHKLARRTETC